MLKNDMTSIMDGSYIYRHHTELEFPGPNSTILPLNTLVGKKPSKWRIRGGGGGGTSDAKRNALSKLRYSERPQTAKL